MKPLKYILSLSLCFIMVFGSVPISSAAAARGISTYEELCAISKNLKGDYYLKNDIVAPDNSEFAAIGDAVNYFRGTLNGKGHTISGLNIKPLKTSSGSVYGGIFSYNGGTVKNLYVENSNVLADDAKWSYIGLIAGINLGSIKNCYVSGTVKNTDISIAAYAGGIAGEMLNGSIKTSASYANVYNSKGEMYTGGIVGYIEKGDIFQCATYGSLFANGRDTTMDAYIGGICGLSRKDAAFADCLFAGGIIAEKCANAYIGGVSGKINAGVVDRGVLLGSLMPAEIVSHTYIGGTAGEEAEEPTVNDCYFVKGAINEELTSESAIELTKSDAALESSYLCFDFNKVWIIEDGILKLRNVPQKAGEQTSVLKGIKITSKPKKLKYTQGDATLDLKGLEVIAEYSDKTQKLKRNEFSIGGYNYAKVGKQKITVNYKGFMDSFSVTVKKSSSPLIGITDISEGAYSDDEPEDKPKPDNDSSKPISTDTSTPQKVESQIESSVTASVSDGGNVAVDNLEPETNFGEEASSKFGAEDESNPKPSISPIAIILIVIAVGIIALAIAFLILRSRSSGEAEISNDELLEVEKDENDIY